MFVEMAVNAVAKKKAQPVKSESADRKPMVVQIRGSAEWKAWVEALADQQRDTVAKMVERSLSKIAKDAGFPDPPKR